MSNLVIVGATGGIGRHLLRLALADGHMVTAVVRNPAALTHEPVRIVRIDMSDPDPVALGHALAGANVVLSALGARSGAEAGVASRGTRGLVEAMHCTGARRIIAVSAASVGTVASPGRPNPPHYNPGDGFTMRHMIAPAAKMLFRRHYADLAVMEDHLRDSGLDWTISRPPRLLNRRLRRTYRTAQDVNVRGGMFIARTDVARHMLNMVDDPRTIHHAIGIAY